MGKHNELRQRLASDVPSILDGVVAAARGGDMQAARLILDRVLPTVKAQEAAVAIDLPSGPLTDQGRAVLAAVAQGQIAPSQGAALVQAIGALARVAEIDELARRVAALEQASDGTKHEPTE